LHLAVASGEQLAIRILIGAGANVDAKAFKHHI